MRIGIVGSRRRTDREAVFAFVRQLPRDSVIITGGARGPDRWAEEAAQFQGLAVIIHRPDLTGIKTRWQATERYYARNQRIVDDADRIVAFVAPDRRGGTEDSIRRAISAGRPVEVR